MKILSDKFHCRMYVPLPGELVFRQPGYAVGICRIHRTIFVQLHQYLGVLDVDIRDVLDQLIILFLSSDFDHSDQVRLISSAIGNRMPLWFWMLCSSALVALPQPASSVPSLLLFSLLLPLPSPEFLLPLRCHSILRAKSVFPHIPTIIASSFKSIHCVPTGMKLYFP